MGPGAGFNPVWLILPCKTGLCGAKAQISRKKPQAAKPSRGWETETKARLEPFVGHLMQIGAVQIGHQDAVGAIEAGIRGIDPNHLATVE